MQNSAITNNAPWLMTLVRGSEIYIERTLSNRESRWQLQSISKVDDKYLWIGTRRYDRATGMLAASKPYTECLLEKSVEHDEAFALHQLMAWSAVFASFTSLKKADPDERVAEYYEHLLGTLADALSSAHRAITLLEDSHGMFNELSNLARECFNNLLEAIIDAETLLDTMNNQKLPASYVEWATRTESVYGGREQLNQSASDLLEVLDEQVDTIPGLETVFTPLLEVMASAIDGDALGDYSDEDGALH